MTDLFVASLVVITYAYTVVTTVIQLTNEHLDDHMAR